MKDFRVEKPKPQTQGAILSYCSENAETFDKTWKEKKDQRRQIQQLQKSSILAIEVNAIKLGKPNKKKKKNQRRTPHTLSKITYYNCDKKGQYLSSYPELPKN